MQTFSARATQIAQWTIASNLLRDHGPAIAHYLRNQMDRSLREYDQAGVSRWLQVTRKIVKLRCPENSAGFH